ncbi:MAG: LamG-like jellyroll fold domain-containing protein [Verrucomicrobiota bacterium]
MSEKDSQLELIRRLLDGDADEQDFAAIERMLRDDPQFRKEYLRYLSVDSALAGGLAKVPRRSPEDFPPPARRFVSWKRMAAAAAGLAALLSAGLWIMRPTPGEPVAVLVASAKGDLRYQGKLQDAGDSTIRTGRFELRGGVSSFRFENGVEVVVEAPASFRVDSALKLTLWQGRLSATVPPEGAGFTVETPAAEVIDFGTEFAVEVAADRSSEVHVFDGSVDVKPLGGPETEPVRLETNAATRIEYESVVPMGIQIDPNRFIRSLKEPKLRYAPAIQALSPALHHRMGMETIGGNSALQYFSRNSAVPFLALGKIGASFRFGGEAQRSFVLVPEYEKSTSGELSGLCWIFADSRPRRATVAANGSIFNDGQFGWSLLRDSGCLQVRVPQNNGEVVSVREKEQLPIGQWQQIAFVADGKTLRLYRNGKQVASRPCGPVARSLSAPLTIGGRLENDGPHARHFWHGRIDEFALFNTALTEPQILELYKIAQRSD